MADTGRTVFADGLFADDFFAVGLWAADEAVTVPDVVGETQADGTSTLEGAGFVVSVETAYSSVVPVGEIISQAPAGGAFAVSGSTVVITVSLGEAPVVDVSTPSGGHFNHPHESSEERKARIKKRRIELGILPEEVKEQLAEVVQEAVVISSQPKIDKQALARKKAEYVALLKVEFENAYAKELTRLWREQIALEMQAQEDFLLLSA